MDTNLTDKGLPISGHHLWTREKYERAMPLAAPTAEIAVADLLP